MKKLHDVFEPKEITSKVAVTYDDGNIVTSVTYEEIDNLSSSIADFFKEKIGFVGVGCMQNVYYPSILLG